MTANKVRQYGFMNTNCAVGIRDLRQMIVACPREDNLLCTESRCIPKNISLILSLLTSAA
ncbi:MAG: hypothetical protein KAQ71_11925 [Desulfobulbaceae bacterium]|nr:hypothetical protein [Desulfobulbaceae bacterium]